MQGFFYFIHIALVTLFGRIGGDTGGKFVVDRPGVFFPFIRDQVEAVYEAAHLVSMDIPVILR